MIIKKNFIWNFRNIPTKTGQLRLLLESSQQASALFPRDGHTHRPCRRLQPARAASGARLHQGPPPHHEVPPGRVGQGGEKARHT